MREPLRLTSTCAIDAPRGELYAWHARPGAFERLVPPGVAVRLVEDSGGIADGARKVLAIGPLGLVRWTALHDSHVAGRQFRDVQVRGPFRRWEHLHRFLDAPGGGSTLVDEVLYEPPLGGLGRALVGRSIEARLTAMFEHRRRVTAHDVELFAREPALDRPIEVRGRSRDARMLAAFLGAGGWRIESVGDVARDAYRIEVGGGEVRTSSGEVLAPLLYSGDAALASVRDSGDAALASVHRALRKRIGS